MKTLSYQYELKIDFDAPVSRHCFTLKCIPKTDGRQAVLSQSIAVLPHLFLREGQDSFGNSYMYGSVQEKHSSFSVSVSGIVQTGLAAGVFADDKYRLGMYAAQTSYTRPSVQLREFLLGLELDAELTDFEKSRFIMNAVHGSFRYEKGRTDVRTTAAQAWELGCGVCQDYAHIMLALCRLCGIRSRYAVGLLTGEGQSHAWVEAESNGVWYGFDPTNNIAVMDEHIKFSHGRDYADCMINRGVFTGWAAQAQTVWANVKENGEYQS